MENNIFKKKRWRRHYGTHHVKEGRKIPKGQSNSEI